jgi:DNA polymerase-3 subunit alpha
MYQLIQQYGEHGQWETPAGRVFPVPSLVEDADGLRLFLCGALIPKQAWESARAQEVQGLLRVLGEHSYCPAEEFDKTRRTNLVAAAYELPESSWHPVEPGSVYEMHHRVRESAPVLPDNSFVHLHTHSEFSPLDGLSTMDEIVGAVQADGQKAIAVTDHGNCAGHPALQSAAREAGIKPIFGIETYFVDDRHSREGASNAYTHLVLWAQNQQGLKNLWALSTEAYREGFYHKPRVDWDTLTRLNSGLIMSTACLGGPLARPYLAGDPELAMSNFSRLGDIFGKRMVIELHANHLEDQIKVNHWLVPLAQKYGVPLVAAVDAHYAEAEHRDDHQVWLAMTTNSDVDDESSLFGGGQSYHMMGVAEVRDALSYLPAEAVESAIANTGKVADMCNAEIIPKKGMPHYSRPTPEHPDVVAHDAQRLLQMCKDNWDERITKYVPREEQGPYLDQIRYEGGLIVDKEYPGYYLTTSDFVTYAKDNGILVGPGRGSGAASLVAYLARITEIDPIQGRLSLDRFLTVGRKSLPDFDIDFPSSRKDQMITYVQQRWGEEHVAQIGNHMRLQNKGTFKGVQSAIASRLPGDSYGAVVMINKIIEAAEASTAGLGLSWSDLFAQVGELLEPYRQSYPELFRLAERFRGRLRTYSTHAAGLVIDPDVDLYAELPMRNGAAGGPMVTQWDMAALEPLGYVKYDFLNLRNLDTLQETIDIIRNTTGSTIDVYGWRDEYEDPEVYEELGSGWTMGVFQIETSLGTRTTKQIRPQTRDELSDVITLGRPGPMRSGLDKMYMRRRAGQEQVAYADPRLEEVLKRTWGAMLYQEDIMAVCRILANYDADEADHVRKILGKKKVDEVAEEGLRFIARAVENNVARKNATDIWDQMGEFARYCVTGDTKIHLAGSNANSDGTIEVEALYRRIHAPKGLRRLDQDECDGCGRALLKHATTTICPPCRSWRIKFHDPKRALYGLSYYADDRIRPARILDVIENGNREVFEVTLADGKSIMATANHRHLSDKGYRRVDELSIGDSLLIDGGYEPQQHEPKNRLTKGDRQGAGYVNGAFGEDNVGYIDGGHAYWSAWRAVNPRICAQCGEKDGRIETAHLDGDHTNNIEGNLAWLCVSCHKSYDYAHNDRRRRWQKGHLVKSVAIVSIKSAGVRPTYDVVMDAPHSFVANGIISHNSFNRAHAYAYATLAIWTAWFKVHYPREFITASMATVDKERIPQFVGEARRIGYQVLPPDINISGRGFTGHELTIRYGIEGMPGIREAKALGALAGQPYASFEDFLERKGPKCDSGTTKRLIRVGAFESIAPNRRALEARIADDESGESTKCVDKDVTFVNEFDLPCHFDWTSEPIQLGRTGKPLKNQKKPPSKCTKACRHYRAKPQSSYEHIEPYTEEEIRNIEVEMLGVYLSSSPFDRVPVEVMSQLLSADDLAVAEYGTHAIVGIVHTARPDPKGRDFGFVTIHTHSGSLDAIVYSTQWNIWYPLLKRGQMALMEIIKDDQDRYRLYLFEPI